MGIKDVAKRLAAGASVALATSGLSNCKDGGVTDPPPPPLLQCSRVGNGQSLTASGRRSADTVTVTVVSAILEQPYAAPTWQVDSVRDVVGASLQAVQLPRARTRDSLNVILRLPPGATTASFTIYGQLIGFENETCAFRRTFTVDLTAVGVKVHEAAPALPLSARDSARIILGERHGRVVELAAHSTFAGPRTASWRVTGGELDATAGSPVRWTLPPEPGIYEAELVIDYGVAGLAVDRLLLEVG